MTTGIDFETYSDVDLKKHGLDPYMSSENFRVLLASVDDEGDILTYDWVFNCVWEFYDGKYYPRESLSAPREFEAFINSHSDTIIAHNAPFERGVFDHLMADGFDWRRIQDSAVMARALGADSALLTSSRQLTNSHKLEVGYALIQRFCIPNDLYPEGPTAELILANNDMDNWLLFIKYCEMDATGGLEISREWVRLCNEFDPDLIIREAKFEHPTYIENINGWHVDLDLVKQMKNRGWANGIIAQKRFVTGGGQQLNFNSVPQMKQYCSERGFPVKSLDKYNRPVHIKKLKARIERLDSPDNGPELKKSVEDLRDVLLMIETKEEIGGSALSKLPKILDLVSSDGRLRHQYVHVGAGSTFRTAAKGVQLQNIKKLGGDVRDVQGVYDYAERWSNTDMADNVRQVFAAAHPEGELLVGDFSGVEARGLAYQAGEEWKLNVFREGRDVYKELFVRFTKGEVKYEDVTKEQRPRGKYSELSCGYQASGKALQSFMFRLGFDISIEDAAKNVMEWREACPAITEYWRDLDRLIKRTVHSHKMQEMSIAYGMTVRISPFYLASMKAQHPGSVSVCVQIILPDGKPFVTRFIHGLYFKNVGEDQKLCYYKPADHMTEDGNLWVADYADPDGKKGPNGKVKRLLYSMYGGKLAGILTQSLCREMFMESSAVLAHLLEQVPNAMLIGQFHDELVVEWWPAEMGWTRDHVQHLMNKAMTHSRLQGFPLDAEIKSAHRYIK